MTSRTFATRSDAGLVVCAAATVTAYKAERSDNAFRLRPASKPATIHRCSIATSKYQARLYERIRGRVCTDTATKPCQDRPIPCQFSDAHLRFIGAPCGGRLLSAVAGRLQGQRQQAHRALGCRLGLRAAGRQASGSAAMSSLPVPFSPILSPSRRISNLSRIVTSRFAAGVSGYIRCRPPLRRPDAPPTSRVGRLS